ncbi:MAG: four helix bundle protein [Flavobacteriales bacterium]
MENAVKSFKDLLVWHKAMELTNAVYDITDKYPGKEVYTITSQMRRSAISVPSNIAEGQQRQHAKEFVQFLNIARGSLAELETQMLIAFGRKYHSETEHTSCDQLMTEIGRMLNGLIRSISNKQNATTN